MSLGGEDGIKGSRDAFGLMGCIAWITWTGSGSGMVSWASAKVFLPNHAS